MTQSFLQRAAVWLVLSFVLGATPVVSVHAAATTTTAVPPPQCTITVNPSSITVGGTVVVHWTSINASAGTITHIGNVGLNGSINTLPSSAAQTTFVGTFTGSGGTATCSATVTVTTSGGGSGAGSTGGTYTTGTDANGNSTYTTGTTYTNTPYSATSYTINPSNFATNPTNSSFTGTQNTVSGGNTNSNPVSSWLVPCGYATGGTYTDNATSCNLCSLGQLIQNFINFLIMVSIPLSAMIFAWAGILYFTAAANPANTKKAKEMFFAVFVGFAFALSGYLIVQTMLNALLNDNFKSGGWSWQSLQCSGNRPLHNTVQQIFENLVNPNATNMNVVTTGGGNVGTDTGIPSAGAAPLGETAARTALAAASGGQITVNHDCADGQTGCITQLGGVKADVIAGAEAIQSSCASANGGSCPMVITGGSESHGGGASDPHAAGNAVDIRTSSTVDAQMRASLGLGAVDPTPSTSGSGYPMQVNGEAFTVYFEGTHWHLQAVRP